MSIENSRLIRNIAGWAGAVDNYFGTVTISGSVLEDNEAYANFGGAVLSNANMAIHDSCIVNNTTANGSAVHNEGGSALDATLNWWGTTDGPSGQGTGSGDSVSLDVTFDPWLTFLPFELDCQGDYTATATPIGGGGSEPTPQPPSVPYCAVSTSSGNEEKRIRSEPSSANPDNIIAIVPIGQTVYIIAEPFIASGTWYFVAYFEHRGWMGAVTLDLTNMNCVGVESLDELGGTPTPTPSPSPIPSIFCIPFTNGQPTDPGHRVPRFQNLIPPCNANGQPMTYIGIEVTPDPRFDSQYGVVDGAATSGEIELLRNLHYGPDDPDPIVSERPVNPEWGTTQPTEEMRREYERIKMLLSDYNSCGFVSLALAMNVLNISTTSGVHPYQLMLSAAQATGNDPSTLRGVNLTLSAFGWKDFLDETNHGVQFGVNAFPLGRRTVDEIIGIMIEIDPENGAIVKVPHAIPMVVLMIDRNQPNTGEMINIGGQKNILQVFFQLGIRIFRIGC